MSIAEGVQARVSYKAYASGTITPGALDVSSSALVATGAQVLRRVSSSLKLGKDTYQSNEVRTDRQIVDYRHGVKRVSGSLSGELSPSTYFELLEAAFRGTAVAGDSFDETDFTSVTTDNATKKITFGAGDLLTTAKLTIGKFLRFTGLSESANNGVLYLITGLGGTTGREVTVYPAPTTMTSDTEFDVEVVGSSLIVPSSSFVSRKFGFEHYFEDVDIAHLFAECRVGGFTMNLPPTGMSTIEIPVMGRNMEALETGSAPFFTSPTDPTSTGILAAVNGLLMVAGTAIGVVTGLNVQMNLNPSSNPVVGQDFVPEIFLGSANVTGQLTAMLQDNVLVNDFINETEVSLLAFLKVSSAANPAAMSVYLPRLKFGDAGVDVQGQAEQTVTLPFQALKYTGSADGVPNTTIQIVDSEVPGS